MGAEGQAGSGRRRTPAALARDSGSSGDGSGGGHSGGDGAWVVARGGVCRRQWSVSRHGEGSVLGLWRKAGLLQHSNTGGR
jgi:hypothetical protein